MKEEIHALCIKSSSQLDAAAGMGLVSAASGNRLDGGAIHVRDAVWEYLVNYYIVEYPA